MKKLAYIMITFLVIFCSNFTYSADLKKIEDNISDTVITTKLTAKFTKSTLLNPFKISISTHDGHIKLSGHVNNTESFLEVLRLAKTTKGVKSIDVGQLEIKPVNTLFTDAYITAKVEAALLKAKILDDESIPLVGINASTENGVVTLTGQVKNAKSIDLILKRVGAVHGVKEIDSKLTIITPN